MHFSILQYIIISFVVVVALIFMADSMKSAMLMAGCLAYILIITNNIMNLHNHLPTGAQAGTQSSAQSNTQSPETANILKSPDDHTAPNADFSDDYKEYDSFKEEHVAGDFAKPPRVAIDSSEKQYSVDLANTLMAQKRFRGKRSMDSATILNADFYKYHYGDELSQAENRVWWGRNEY